jgi:ElaB/YqjD/DUF883 family membrane-anchored ribosome-binding protein
MAGNTGKPVQRAEETATNLGHRAQEAATALGHRAQEAASTAAQRASDFASQAQERAEDARTGVGQGMTALAGQLRQNAPEGTLGTAAGAVADRLQQTGRYLQEHDFRDMADDMTNVIRRYPLPALCIGFGAGFLLGMALTRR